MLSQKLMIGWIGLLLSAWGGYYFYSNNSSDTTTTGASRILTVSTGSTESTIKATGNISAFEESTLSFGREGIVAAIYKNEWDTVKTWDLIAEISAWTVSLDMESAGRNLSDAQATYDELFDDPDPADFARARAALEESESSLTLMEWQYEALLIEQKNKLSESNENLSLLKQKLALAESEYEYTEKNITPDDETNNLEKDIESAWNLVEDTARSFEATIDSAESITGMDYKASELYGDIGSLNTALKTRTDILYQTVLDNNSIYQTGVVDIRNNNKQKEFDTVYAWLQDTKAVVTDLISLFNLILQELDATPANSSWSSTKIDTARSDIQTILSSLASKQNTINSTLITLKNYGSDELQDLADKNTLASKSQSLESAKIAVAKAERDIETLKKDQELSRISSQNNIKKQKNTIEQNTYSYQDLIDGPTATEKRNAESKLISARISLEKSKEWMKDYQITASFDGTVEDIPWAVWETAETSKWILIANKNAYKIELSLDQIDIVKVKEWMPAKVTLDAYANKEFTGSVISISATPTITSGVVSYTATVWLSIDDVEVMSNMSTTVTIIIASNNDTILIPSWAITSRAGKSYVTISPARWTTGKTEEREVTLGTTTNWQVQVLSWLTIGEHILISTGSNTSGTRTRGQSGSTNTTNSNQLLRGVTGGGAGGGGGAPRGF